MQIAVKAVNNIAKLDRLVLTLFVFSVYLRLTLYDTPLLTVIKKAKAIRTAMKELCCFYAKR